MNRLIQLLLLSALFNFGCNGSNKQEHQAVTSAKKANLFENKAIGWTIAIPEGFKSLSENRVQQNEQQGKEAIKNASGQNVTTDQLIHLLNFQKNQFNSFSATLEPFDESKDGDYLKRNQDVKKLIFDTYKNLKIKADSSSFKNTFAGQVFNGFLVKIYGPNGDIVMHQIMLSQLRKGYDFGVNINYNNENDANLMLDALKNSKFSD